MMASKTSLLTLLVLFLGLNSFGADYLGDSETLHVKFETIDGGDASSAQTIRVGTRYPTSNVTLQFNKFVGSWRQSEVVTTDTEYFKLKVGTKRTVGNEFLVKGSQLAKEFFSLENNNKSQPTFVQITATTWGFLKTGYKALEFTPEQIEASRKDRVPFELKTEEGYVIRGVIYTRSK